MCVWLWGLPGALGAPAPPPVATSKLCTPRGMNPVTQRPFPVLEGGSTRRQSGGNGADIHRQIYQHIPLSCQAQEGCCSIRVIRGFPPEGSGGERDAVAHESDMCPKSVPGSCQGPDEPAHS